MNNAGQIDTALSLRRDSSVIPARVTAVRKTEIRKCTISAHADYCTVH